MWIPDFFIFSFLTFLEKKGKVFPLVSNRPLFRGDGLYGDERKSRNGGSIGTRMLKLRTDERTVLKSSAKRNSKWSY